MTSDGPPATDSRPGWRSVIVIGLLSLVIRLLVLAEMRVGNPTFRFALVDDAMYLQMAQEMLDGTNGDWLMAPLHAWVLALLGLVFPLGIGLACASNAVFGAITTALIVRLAQRIHSDRAAWLAGGLHALVGGFVFSDIVPGQAALLGLLHAAGSLLALRLWERRGDGPVLRDAGLLGVLTGVAMLGRGTSLAIAFAAIPALFRTEGAARRGKLAGALAAGLVLVLGAAATRNLVVSGDFSPFHWNGGPNLYASNGPESRELTLYIHSEAGNHPATIRDETRRIAQAAAGEGAERLTPGEVSRFWVERTWEERGSLGEHALHFAKKAGLFLSGEEVGNIHAPLVEARYSLFLTISPVRLWWVLTLGLAGWWMVRARRPQVDVILPVVLATWAALTLYFPVARMRIPVATLCLVPAAAGLLEALRPDAAPRRARYVVGIVVLTILAWLPYRPFDGEVGAFVNIAEAHRGLDHSADEIEAALTEALALDPANPEANLLLGRALLESDPPRSLTHLDRAARDPVHGPAAARASIRAFAAAGRLDEAEKLVHTLMQLDAQHPETLAYAAVVALRAGAPDEAKRRLATARFYGPDHAAVRWALAETGFDVAELDRLIDALRKG